MARIIFVNRYFFPDESATSLMLTDLAFSLARQGHQTCVLTSRQRIDDPQADLPAHESAHGVSIRRIWTSNWGRANLLGRAIDYATFYASAAIGLFRLARRGDVIVAKTDPPLIGVVAWFVARLRGARLVNWWQDIYPEVAEELGVPGISLLGPPLRIARRATCRAAAHNVVVGRCMARRIEAAGASPASIEVIPNWSDDVQVRPRSAEGHPLRQQWQLDGTFCVGYSGNLGRGHDFDALLGAAGRLADLPSVRFLFIGAGARRDLVERRARELALDSVVFRPFQPRDQLGLSLTVPDVHVVSLRPELCGLIVPSKFYGALAAGRPVIFLGPEESEVAHVIRDADCGAVVDAADADRIERVVRELERDRPRCARQGRNARAVVESRYARERSTGAWRELLESTLRRNQS